MVGLVWAPPRTLLQPEWCALVLGLAALVVAVQRPCSRIRELCLALAAAALLTGTVLMKWSTVSTAAAVWAAMASLCWRRPSRLLRITAATAVLLPLTLGLQALLVPHELLWMREIPQLNPPDRSLDWCTPLAAPRSGCRLQTLLVNETVTSPVLLLLPAAVLTLLHTTRVPCRAAAVAIPVVTVATTLATTALQGQWFSYHLAALPVLAAGWLGWAIGLVVQERGRPPWALLLLLAGTTAVDVSLLALPASVRTGGGAVWSGLSAIALAYWLAVGVAAVAALLAVLVERPPARDAASPSPASQLAGLPTTAMLVVMIGQLSSVLPHTAYSLTIQSSDRTAANVHAQHQREVALAQRIHQRIGPKTTVVYLGFGDRAYWLGNPSRCRYAAATYLQRSGYLRAGQLQGFRENLSCLADPGTDFVLIQKGWVALERADPRVRQTVDLNFDCVKPVLDERNILVCARR